MRTNTKSFSFFLKSGSSLPVPPANFLDLDEKLVLTPSVKTDTFSIFNGKLGQRDSYADVGDVTIEGATLSHKMKFQNEAGDALDTLPAYSELLKAGGFTETVDTSTPTQETVTYTWNNTTAPAVASAVYFMDGKKQTMTNKVALSVKFNITVGEPVTIEADMSTFFDNNGIATSEANPTVEVPTGLIVAHKLDVLTKDGTPIVGGNNIVIDMGSVINKRYGFGLDEYETTDFEPTFKVEFPVEQDDYNAGIQALLNQSQYDIVLKLGTNNGTPVNGKTVVMTITNVKLSENSDSDNEDNLTRTNTFIFTADTEFTIKHGYYSA